MDLREYNGIRNKLLVVKILTPDQQPSRIHLYEAKNKNADLFRTAFFKREGAKLLLAVIKRELATSNQRALIKPPCSSLKCHDHEVQ